MDLNDLAIALSATRRSKRIKQGILARAAGVDQSYLAALETGRRRTPSKKILEKLCVALKTTDPERQRIFKLAAIGELADFLRARANVPEMKALQELAELMPMMRQGQIDQIVAIAAILAKRDPTEGEV